jgi:hypothetical protein
MDWLNNSDWMKSPTVRMAMTVLISAMPAIIADLSSGKVSWLTATVVIANMLVTAKAFMSNPDADTKPPSDDPFLPKS